MTRYPAYPEYKVTGCDWFPRIPAHWQIDRAKWSVSSCQNGVWGSEPEGDDDLVCIRVADFDRQSLRISTKKLTQRSIAEKERRNRLLVRGDLLLEKSGGGEQQLVGSVVEFDQTFPAVSSNFIAKMVVKEGMDSRFLVYTHAHLYAGRVNFRSIKQTTGIQNLDGQSYLDEEIAYPPLEEQDNIARFLDFKTAQIDALIAKKNALLDKLAEKRTAIISHAVTKGLDPSVQLKDSGATWLGKVPNHWQVLQLKFAVTFQRGHDLPADARIEGEVPLVSSSGISSSHDSAIAKGPGIVTGRYGTIGKFTYVESDYWPLNTTLYSINTHGNNVKYLWFMMHMLSDLFVMESKKGAVPGVDRNDLHPVLTVLPPKSEQDEIVARLEEVTSNLDRQAEQITKVIDRLQEYKLTLTTNAVTGAIDLRSFEPPRPT
ncbi:MAG: restriction endonuclease subunit S [Ideonella sp. MAG2]|nr:MAG: restriction endonuclease subunit S [Ideonella sp. MAG2]